MSNDPEPLQVICCFECGGMGFFVDATNCRKCSGTGSLFWVDGRAFPYTPDGENTARAALEAARGAGEPRFSHEQV